MSLKITSTRAISAIRQPLRGHPHNWPNVSGGPSKLVLPRGTLRGRKQNLISHSFSPSESVCRRPVPNNVGTVVIKCSFQWATAFYNPQDAIRFPV